MKYYDSIEPHIDGAVADRYSPTPLPSTVFTRRDENGKIVKKLRMWDSVLGDGHTEDMLRHDSA